MPHDESPPLTIRPNRLPDDLPDTVRTIAPALPTESLRLDGLIAPPGFELGELIGRGGMGVVYAARDREVGRDVAVKFLRPEFLSSASAARRFVDEARITGQLQHPGIPAVYRVGTTPEGGPFLAMKLVKGRTLADLLAERLSPAADRESLVGIFEGICQAVGYAHAHRVIHRDLKPQNVMVGAFGEVQVMDWGLAKVLTAAHADPEPTKDPTDPPTIIHVPREGGDATSAGSVMGTPAYLPPEQAVGAVRQIDTRSDVFGLGGILCIILTGKPPYVSDSPEMTRLLAAQAKLADAFARLDDCGADPALIALCKHCLAADPLDRPADGSVVTAAVATIQAAATERARHAERAAAAAEVRAAEERKHRRVIQWSGLAVGCVLAGGAAISAWQMVKAREAEMNAVEREHREYAARQEADRQAADAKKAKDFVLNVLAFGRDGLPTGDRSLDVAAKSADEFAGQPRFLAELRATIGLTYLRLDRPAEAETQLKEALRLWELVADPHDRDTLTSVHYLGVAKDRMDRKEEAEELYRRSLDGREKAFGPDDKETLTSVHALAGFLNGKGEAYHDEAERLYRRALAGRVAKLPANDPATLGTMNNLAGLMKERKQYAEAERLFLQVLAARKQALTPNHPDTLTTVHNLSTLYRDMGQFTEAEPLARQALKGRTDALGPTHESTLYSILNLAVLLAQTGRGADAVPLFDRYLAGREKQVAAKPEKYATDLANVARNLLQAGEFAVAERRLRTCFAIREIAEPTYWTMADTRSMLGGALLGQGHFAEAEPHLLAGFRGLNEREKDIPQANRDRLTESLDRLIALCDATQRPADAAKWRAERAKYPAEPARPGR